MEEWYVVRTKPRQEQLALENLERQSYQCFCPWIARRRKRIGKIQVYKEAFFPGYLFVKMDLDSTNTSPICSTRGVNGLISFGSSVIPVREDVINTLRLYITSNGLIEWDHPDFISGQELCIEDGPMEGLNAIFQAKKGEDRAILLLNLLGEYREVEIPISALR